MQRASVCTCPSASSTLDTRRFKPQQQRCDDGTGAMRQCEVLSITGPTCDKHRKLEKTVLSFVV